MLPFFSSFWGANYDQEDPQKQKDRKTIRSAPARLTNDTCFPIDQRVLLSKSSKDVNNGISGMLQTSPYNEVIKGLYVGDFFASQQSWQQFNLIVNCSKQIPMQAQVRNLKDPKCIRVPVDDHPIESMNMYRYMKQYKVLEKMRDVISKGGTVLVHCHAGQQRSCAIVACYLIRYHDLNPNEAVIFLKQKRNVAFLYGVNFLFTLTQLYNENAERVLG
jgi:Dual specificity phosphatase, catalytic domain